jgi:sugar O-acyltransferase (sialic acid O-acetyltransferase NeuD family)
MGEDLFAVETSKGVVVVQAEADGYIFITANEYTYYAVDDVVAYICDSQDDFMELEKKLAATEDASSNTPNITQKALKLAKKHGIDISKLELKKVIKEKDIQQLLENSIPEKVEGNKPKYTCNDVIILCGGGLCKMSIDAIRSRGGINIRGIIDYSKTKGTKILDVEVLGPNEILEDLYRSGIHSAINAMGSISIDNTSTIYFKRKELFEKLKSIGYNFPNIIHSSATVSSSAIFGEGNLVFENAVIGSDAVIGDDTIINTGVIISHDCVIGDHCRISPGATLAGSVTIGNNTTIGMGTTIYIGVHIGDNVIIANGKNIFSDVPDNIVIK